MVNVSLRDRQTQPSDLAPRAVLPGLGWLRALPRWPFALAGIIGLILFGGVALDVTIKRMGDRAAQDGLTLNRQPLQFDMAAARIAVPANMIRFAEQRRAGATERLDLFVYWPDFDGLSQEHAEEFANSAVPVMFVSLTPPNGVRDPIVRLETVYQFLFTGASWIGPRGLVGRRLAAESAYGREELYYEPGSTDPFLARCLDASDADLLPVCLVEFNFEGLSVFYRFNRALLPEWRAIDRGMRTMLSGFAR